jgi:hypothetical protein
VADRGRNCREADTDVLATADGGAEKYADAIDRLGRP